MIWNRLKHLWPAWRRQEERDMREELESLAAIAGRKELGNLTLAMENVRETWGWTWIDSIVADIRYSLRALRSQPAFFLLAVVSLALAIGANSAIFSFADALLLRPLPVADPSAVFDVINTTPDNPFEGMSFPDYRDLREKSRSFAGLAAYRLTPIAAATNPAAPAQIRLAMLVSDNFFSVVGVAPVIGRAFVREEANAPGDARAIISYDFWQQQYAGDRSVIGRSLRLNGIVFTVIGVAPEYFAGLDRFVRPTIYVPLGMSQRLAAAPADPLEDRSRHELVVKGRLSPGSSQESAQAELATIGAALEHEYPKTNHNRHPAIRTELQRRIQQTPQMLALIKMLMGLVGLILIIACSNVANLLLARARARSHEIAIRLSIGAGRRRLVRQLMTESLILAVAGGGAGLLCAYGGIRLLQTLSVPSEPPSVLGVQLDWRVVEFSFFAALVSCVFFGLAPAWRTVRMDFVSALKAGGHGVSGQPRTIGRDVLVVAQVALAMVVLIAAGMFLDGFRKMLVMTPDFRTDHVITMDTAPALLHYSPEQTMTLYRGLVDHVQMLAGVKSVAMTESLPLSPAQTTLSVVPEGYQFPKGREKAIVFGAAVDARYFSTMNIEIKRGRAFTEDDRARVAARGNSERAVREDLLAEPGSDWKADPARYCGWPRSRSRRNCEDRPLSAGQRAAGLVRVPSLRAKPALANDLDSAIERRSGCARRTVARCGSIDGRQPADIQPPYRSDTLRKPRHGYVAAVLPDGGDDGVDRPRARNDRALWARRLHGKPSRQGIRHPRRPGRGPP